MSTKSDVLIIGGGLAGLTAGIHLSQMGISVTIIEKNTYPKHKVCGEYISNEVLPYWNELGIEVSKLLPTQITQLEFSLPNGRAVQAPLPMGGFGLSRYVLEAYLYQKAIAVGCTICTETVESIHFAEDMFTITTDTPRVLTSHTVFGAYGKRSNIDLLLRRSFVQHKSPWLAVKAHYTGDFKEDWVGLHHFKGGYCGVSKVENNTINICYLADFETFKKYKNITDYQENVVCGNPILKRIFNSCQMVFEKPLTISQISFEAKLPVENHILMLGDSAGLIHPLCGNGMAMAIHSAKIASELLLKYRNHEIQSRVDLERKYTEAWNLHFKKRMQTGRILARVLQNQQLSKIILQLCVAFPKLLKGIITMTHGKPITMTTLP